MRSKARRRRMNAAVLCADTSGLEDTLARWARGHGGGHIGPLAQAWAQYNDQEQTMAVSEAANAWRTGTPEPGVVVEVWSWLRVTAAVWTGEEWRTAGPDGEVLRFISHWRPVAGEG